MPTMLHRGCQILRLEVSLKKAEVLYQPSSRDVYRAPHILIGATKLKAVHRFVYIGCTIPSDAGIGKEVGNRMANASIVFDWLYKHVTNNRHLKNGTQIRVYRAIVFATLLYGSESSFTCQTPAATPGMVPPALPPTILTIHWSDFSLLLMSLMRRKSPGLRPYC